MSLPKENEDLNWEGVLAKARMHVRQHSVYYMRMILKFIPVAVPGIKTMGVTKGLVLMVDPDWVVTLPIKKVAATLVHEANHPLRDHINRMLMLNIPPDQMDMDLINIAMDLPINYEMRAAGWELPHGYFPEDFGLPEGLSFEEYLKALQQQQKPQQSLPSPGRSSAPQDGDGSGKGKKNQQPQQIPSKAEAEKHEHGPASGRCGGIAGNPIDKELEDKLDKEFGRSKDDVLRTIKSTLNDIKEWVASNGRGSVPGDLIEQIKKSQEKPAVKWTEKLRHILRRTTGRIESGGKDFSLARLSKRSFIYGIPRPGLVAYQAEVCFILDTSGSMGTKQIHDSLREAVGVMTAMGIDLAWFLQADAAVTAAAKKVRVKDILNVKIRGRGGTDFDPALRAAEQIRPRPDLIIYFTDGDGAARQKPTGIDVVWAVVTSHWNRTPSTNFGHTILIPAG